MRTALTIAFYVFDFLFAIAVFSMICGEWVIDRMKLHAWIKWANQKDKPDDKT